jgi:hypothetical protein
MTRFVGLPRRLAPFALVAVLAGAAVGCFGPSPGGPVPVMGQSDLNAEQMTAYFWAHQPPGSPCLTVSVEQLSADFQWHGNAENIRGDIAFAQPTRIRPRSAAHSHRWRRRAPIPSSTR